MEEIKEIEFLDLAAMKFPVQPVTVAYDANVKAITFHDRETGRFLYDWGTEPANTTRRRIIDLFDAISNKRWSSPEITSMTADVLRKALKI
jgi:hypothetical protein